MRGKLFIVLVLVLLFAFTACGSNGGTASQNDSNGGDPKIEPTAAEKKDGSTTTGTGSDSDGSKEKTSTGVNEGTDGGQIRPERRNGTEEAEDDSPLISEEEAVGKTIENEKIVIKYTGSGKGFGFKEIQGARQYYVMTGFMEDGVIDEWKGTVRIWYFFDDEATYTAGIEKYGESAVKEKNKNSLFFNVSAGYDNTWKTFSNVVEEVENKKLSWMIIEDTEYELVK